MRLAIAVATLLSFCGPAWSGDYRLDPGVEIRGASLKVEPSVAGPAGKAVRYEISVRRGSSSSSQSGHARIDDAGHAKLASSSVSIQPGQSYDIEVKLFEGDRLVARESVRHP